MEHVDFVEKIHIAAYWRKQLGEYEYVDQNPDDLLRWYLALETRGPTEIRNYLIERASRYPSSVVTGIVQVAPHPPLTIVELWLASHERTRTGPYWIALAAFCVFGYVAATNLQACSVLVNPNRLASHPAQTSAPVQPGTFNQFPTAGPSTLPSPSLAPPNTTPGAGSSSVQPQ